MLYNFLSRYYYRRRAPAVAGGSVVIVDSSGAGDFTGIKAAVLAVNPTSAHPIKLFVRDGTYNDIQILGKDYLTIEGQSQAGTIMIADGLRTDVDPISGQRYVDMAQSAKSAWFIHNNMTIKNMTVRTNDTKYCVHADDTGAYILHLIGARFQHSNQAPIGIGSRYLQQIIASGCTFEKLGANIVRDAAHRVGYGAYGVFFHNWNVPTNGGGPTYLTLADCNFINCGLVSVSELGSDYIDMITVTNCVTDDATKGFAWGVSTLYWDGGGHIATEIPYNINLHTVGGTFPAAIDYDIANRPDLMNYVIME